MTVATYNVSECTYIDRGINRWTTSDCDMKRAVQNGVGQRRIKGKYLLVCIVGNDNKRRRLLSFLLPNGGKKERKKMKWAGREYESHLCIFSRSASNSLFLFPSLDVIKMIEIFLSRVGSIRRKQREKVNNKNGQNLALCRTSSSGFYIQAYTLGDLV